MWMIEWTSTMDQSQQSLSLPHLKPPVRCHPSCFLMWMAKWMSVMGCRVNIQLPLRMVGHRPCHLIELGQSGHTLSDDVLICRMVFLTVPPVRRHPSWFSMWMVRLGMLFGTITQHPMPVWSMPSMPCHCAMPCMPPCSWNAGHAIPFIACRSSHMPQILSFGNHSSVSCR